MSEATESGGNKVFPIQLRRVDVGEISYSCDGFALPTINPISDFTLETGRSDFNKESKAIQVSVIFQSQTDPKKTGLSAAYSLRVRVNAEFTVVSDDFPLDKVEKWAEYNGVTVLLPFLRELVHSTTLRTGFKPFIMPMLEARVYKVGVSPQMVS